MIIAIGILIVLVIILAIKLSKKQRLDTAELDDYNNKILELTQERAILDQNVLNLSRAIAHAQLELDKIRSETSLAQEQYNDAIKRRAEELDQYISEQREQRSAALLDELDNKKRLYQKLEEEEQHKADEIVKAIQEAAARAQDEQNQIEAETLLAKERYEALLAPIRQYEMERQQRLFYTIQVPDEYKDDINFLVMEVSQKVQHPDIINKLVWNEYVKTYIEDTFRRVGIEDKPGIYKITNLDNGKAYIGKSTNVKKRLADHFKSSVGIKTIADQAVHHEIWKTGFWNWTLEVVIYCDKEQLNELEKYYINFFDTVNNGYNKNSGGGG